MRNADDKGTVTIDVAIWRVISGYYLRIHYVFSRHYVQWIKVCCQRRVELHDMSIKWRHQELG